MFAKTQILALMGRQPCCDKIGLRRGPWSIEEDHKLMNFVLNNGIQCWRLVPKLAGLFRCGKSCRLRWINYLRPDLKRGALTAAEEDMIIQLHSHYGNRWSKIASHFPGRTDNEIKNHWNTRIKKRLKLLGLDPTTHKPIEQPEMFTTKELDCRVPSSFEQHQMFTTKDKVILQSNSFWNQANNNLELDLHDSLCSKGTSMAISATQPSNASASVSEPVHEDFLQQWIDNPNSMLSWDGFNNLEEIFL
ncbi:unnamed protein product [Camellia sinensis]